MIQDLMNYACLLKIAYFETDKALTETLDILTDSRFLNLDVLKILINFLQKINQVVYLELLIGLIFQTKSKMAKVLYSISTIIKLRIIHQNHQDNENRNSKESDKFFNQYLTDFRKINQESIYHLICRNFSLYLKLRFYYDLLIEIYSSNLEIFDFNELYQMVILNKGNKFLYIWSYDIQKSKSNQLLHEENIKVDFLITKNNELKCINSFDKNFSAIIHVYKISDSAIIQDCGEFSFDENSRRNDYLSAKLINNKVKFYV